MSPAEVTEADVPRIEYLGELVRLQMEPGDIVVLMVPGPVHPDAARRMEDYLQRALPGAKCLVLGDGIRLGLLGSAT